MTPEETFYRDLRCELTDSEVAAVAEELALQVGEREKTETAKASAAAAFGATLKAQAQEIGLLGRKVRDKAEQRAIECQRIADYKQGVMETVRLDTGEVISRRALTVEERQGQLLPLEAPPAEQS